MKFKSAAILGAAVVMTAVTALPAQAVDVYKYGNTTCSGTRTGYVYGSASGQLTLKTGPIGGSPDNQAVYFGGGGHLLWGKQQSISWGINGDPYILTGYGSCG